MIGLLERLACDHAIPVAAFISLGAIALAVVDADRQLRSSAELGRTRTATVAVLAAEEAAAQAVVDDLRQPATYRTSWDLAVRVVPSKTGPRALELNIAALGRELRFGCEVLAGAAPVCFAHAFTSSNAEIPAWVAAKEPHIGDLPTLGPVVTGPLPPEVVADADVALLQLPAGTDRTDFVLGRDASRIRVISGRGGVKVVPGNLWVPPGDGPLVFVVDVPMTIHVTGNIYLGRSLCVEGPGALTLTAGLFARASADSAPLEGEGDVHLGWPRGTTNEGSPAPLAVGAHLVVRGNCIARASGATVHGAFVLGGRFVRATPGASVEISGRHLANVDRLRIPGFAVAGSPRPGHLRALPQRDRPVGGERQKTLSFGADRR